MNNASATKVTAIGQSVLHANRSLEISCLMVITGLRDLGRMTAIVPPCESELGILFIGAGQRDLCLLLGSARLLGHDDVVHPQHLVAGLRGPGGHGTLLRHRGRVRLPFPTLMVEYRHQIRVASIRTALSIPIPNRNAPRSTPNRPSHYLLCRGSETNVP